MYDVDLGLVLVRVVVGVLMFAHGAQKLFGWFNGYGIEGTGGYFESIGYRSGMRMSVLAGVTETGAGVLLALGLLTPLAAAALVGLMINVAIAGHGNNGFWNHNTAPGWEFPMVLAAIAATLGITGPGAYSLDRYVGFSTGLESMGLIAIGAGAAVGIVFLSTFRHPLHEEDGSIHADRAA